MVMYFSLTRNIRTWEHASRIRQKGAYIENNVNNKWRTFGRSQNTIRRKDQERSDSDCTESMGTHHENAISHQIPVYDKGLKLCKVGFNLLHLKMELQKHQETRPDPVLLLWTRNQTFSFLFVSNGSMLPLLLIACFIDRKIGVKP